MSVCLSVCPSALLWLNRLTYDLDLAWRLTLTPGRIGLKVKVISQRSRSNIKIVFLRLEPEMRSKVKVKGQISRPLRTRPLSEKGVRGKGCQGQGQSSRAQGQGHC